MLRGPDGAFYGPYHHEYGDRQRFCITGDAYRSAMRQVMRELCEHDVDGIYLDGPCGYRGICFCDSCRSKFKQFSGLEISRLAGFVQKHAQSGLPNDPGILPDDVDMEALEAWYAWANHLVQEDLTAFREIAHRSGKFLLCHNGVTWFGTALVQQNKIPDGFLEEASMQTFERLVTGFRGASMARPSKQLAQIYMGSYAVNWFGQPAYDQPWTTNDTNVEDGDEVVMEGLTDLASGNAPIYCTANRLYYSIGSGSVEPAREIFELMARSEPVIKDSVPVPYVTVLQTWESLQLWRTRRRSWNKLMTESFALAMLDSGISVDIAPSTEMTDSWLEAQRVIALCGASGISDDQATKLHSWVKQGGGLLATYDSGLYDEHGRLRDNGGALREVLGVSIVGEPLAPQPECYFRVLRSHAALGEYGAKSLFQADLRIAPVEAAPDAEIVADCWNLGTDQTRGPAIIVHRFGRGLAVYVSGSLEGFYAASRITSLRHILASIVNYLGKQEPLPFRLRAPRGVYGILREATNGDRALWILANVGFKDAAAGRMRQEFVPVSNLEVGIRIPKDRKPKSLYLVRARRNVPFQVEGEYAVATITSVHIGELVHLALN
jgi:hypothetical protein